MDSMDIKVVKNEFGDYRRAVPMPAAEKAAALEVEKSDIRATVKAMLRSAMEVLKRLPLPPEYAGLRRCGSCMPDIVHEKLDAGRWKPRRARPVVPSTAEIDEMERTLAWLQWLDGDARWVVTAWAAGLSFRKLAGRDPGRRSRTQMHRIFESGITIILQELVGETIKKRKIRR